MNTSPFIAPNDSRYSPFELSKKSAKTGGASSGQKKIITFAEAKIKAGFDCSFSQNLSQYQLNGSEPVEKKMLYKLAKLQAGSRENNLAKYIKNYGFDPSIHEEKLMLFKLAKKEASTNSASLAVFIKNFGFDSSKSEDHNMLLEIFNLAIEHEPTVTNHLDNFDLLDLEKRFEIGMDFARKINPEHVSSFNVLAFVDLNEKGAPRRLIALFNELFIKNPYDAIESFQYYVIEAIESFEDLNGSSQNQDLLKTFNEVLSMLAYGDVSTDLLQSSLSRSPKFISSLEKGAKISNPHTKYTTLTYLGYLACFALSSKKEAELLQNLNDSLVLEALEKIFDPSLRMTLIPVLSGILEQSKDLEKVSVHFQIPILLLQICQRENCNEMLAKREKNAILSLKTTLKDGTTYKALIKTLLALSKIKNLRQEAICNVIEFSLNAPKSSKICSSQLNQLTAILNLDAGDLLENQVLDFTAILEEAFKRKIPLLTYQEGFAEKLMTTFQSSRKPAAIFEYVATLEKLTEPTLRSAAQKALSEFIISVLNGTFETDRIALADNPHLKALHEHQPAIFKKWTERHPSKKIEIKENPVRIFTSVDPYDILNCGTEIMGSCQNINGNPSLNRGVLGYLLNGHQMITLKADNPNLDKEPIIGRSMLRLALLKDNSPVLFLEKIYPKTLDESYKLELKTYAQEYAKALGCPLVSKEEGDMSRKFNAPILSLGGRAAEYVDAISGISEDGIYMIEEAFYV